MNYIVIGATQGLGLSLTRKLLSEGHKVAAGVVDRQTPAALQELLSAHEGSLRVFQADVTNEPELQAGAALCKEFFGEADALCNVAGVLLPGDRVKLIHECDTAELRKTMEINAIGPILVGKSFLSVMKKGGKIFTVTSEGVAVKSCGTWVPCYGLSKTAATKVSGLFNMAVQDVDFYSVHPGRMNTEMGRTTAQIEPEESAEGFFNLMTGVTPVSRDTWYINYKGEEMDA